MASGKVLVNFLIFLAISLKWNVSLWSGYNIPTVYSYFLEHRFLPFRTIL